MKHWQSVVLQVGALVLAASAVGLGANAVRDARNHLDLSRNYFRKVPVAEPAQSAAQVQTAPDTTNGTVSSHGSSSSAVADHGHEVMTFAEAMEMFNDDMYQEGTCIFIDARDDDAYQEGHVPLAYQLDNFRAEAFMEELRPIVQSADRIVVYCNGGNCDDSILVATYLIYDEDVDAERVYVFEGGMEEWVANDGPVTEGPTP